MHRPDLSIKIFVFVVVGGGGKFSLLVLQMMLVELIFELLHVVVFIVVVIVVVVNAPMAILFLKLCSRRWVLIGLLVLVDHYYLWTFRVKRSFYGRHNFVIHVGTHMAIIIYVGRSTIIGRVARVRFSDVLRGPTLVTDYVLALVAACLAQETKHVRHATR